MRTANHRRLQIVAWPEDRRCERDWLLEKIAGATGAIVMLSDKVGVVFIPWLRTADEMENLLLDRRRVLRTRSMPPSL